MSMCVGAPIRIRRSRECPGTTIGGSSWKHQTGGRSADGTMDTRGVTEKAADAVTGDRTDDKTGKRVI